MSWTYTNTNNITKDFLEGIYFMILFHFCYHFSFSENRCSHIRTLWWVSHFGFKFQYCKRQKYLEHYADTLLSLTLCYTVNELKAITQGIISPETSLLEQLPPCTEYWWGQILRSLEPLSWNLLYCIPGLDIFPTEKFHKSQMQIN